MSSLQTRSPKINVITSKKENVFSVPRIVYKNLPLSDRLNRKVNIEYVANGIKEERLYYHPFWIGKILVIAARNPFPPKITPQMVFVDAVSGYRGILSNVPYFKEKMVDQREVLAPIITSKEQAHDLILDIQKSQINSMYMMKKPDYKIKEITLSYLPLLKVLVRTPLINKEMLLNVNTGENEEYLLKKIKENR